MSEGNSVSLINLGDLSKPADTLIVKISNAIGGIFAPYQITRIAKAEAAASLIKAQTEIQMEELHQRAMYRFIEEEAHRQQNMEEITNKALPLLSDTSDPSKLEDDWVVNFFDKARIVSDLEMQTLWANILAGEVNNPGSFSRRTVNFLNDIDKNDAKMFQALCSFGWVAEDSLEVFVFDEADAIYNDHGVTFASLTHLKAIGLIIFDHTSGFQLAFSDNRAELEYFGRSLVLISQNEPKGFRLNIGKVLLTQVGTELATVCKPPKVDQFFDYVKGKLIQHHPQYICAEAEGATKQTA